MEDCLQLRACNNADHRALEVLYPKAFPDEDLLPLLRALFDEQSGVISIVATFGGALVGHCVMTLCHHKESKAMDGLLGPVAVDPAFQKQGIGTRMIEEALGQLKRMEATQVHVLGDPAYYGRFGFKPNAQVKPPYPLPTEWFQAWQFMRLQDDACEQEGTLIVPKAWCVPHLWAP